MKVLVNCPFKLSAAERQALANGVPGIEIIEDFRPDPDQLDGTGVEALVTEQVPKNLSRWPQLRFVQLLSAGSNQLLGHPIQATSIPVTTASGTHGVPIAQYVTCAVLMLAHRMPELLEFKPTRKWPNRTALAGFTLRGRTAGILGYGSIGRECGRQLAGLGMRVICLKKNPAARRDEGFNAWPDTGDPEGTIPAAWHGPDQLAEFLSASDFVIVTLPSTPATEGMIGEREFKAFKPGAHLVIISRGGIVNEAALADALRGGRLGGAVVDCFVREPVPPDHPFFEVPRLVMTPHMSGVYDNFWPVFQRLLLENLQRLRERRPLLNEVDRTHGY
jgi:phosphoglycerate dehydrogenase-like enzyme